MLQTSAVTQPRLQPESQEAELLDPLLRLAGDIRNTHALIVAEHGLDVMCGLIRRGCLAATMLRLGDKPDADVYDMVFVPRVSALPSSEAVIRLARASLKPNGRLIAGVNHGSAAVALARRLRLNGFSAIRSLRLPDCTLLGAERRRLS